MNKKALSLLEVALVLTVISIAFIGISKMMADSAGATRAKVVSERMEQIADAAQAYINTNRSAIQAHLAANPTATISIPVAKQTEVAGQPTGTAGFQSIQAAGFLPPGFVDRTSNGQSHALLIKAAPGNQIDAMLLAYGGTPIADRDLTTIVTNIGAAGGAVYDEITATPDIHIVGAQAGWSYAINQWAGSINGAAVAPSAGRPAVSLTVQQGAAASTPSGSSSPVASIEYLATNVVPAGYLAANGQAVSRSTYADLFATIGTTFGAGNGSTTFNVPDLRGEFIRGWDAGRGVDTGRVFGSAQAQSVQPHNHQITNTGGAHNVSYGNAPLAAGSGFGGYSNSFTGNSAGTETRPRNIALMPMIKF